jgi:hypothetical protein
MSNSTLREGILLNVVRNEEKLLAVADVTSMIALHMYESLKSFPMKIGGFLARWLGRHFAAQMQKTLFP